MLHLPVDADARFITLRPWAFGACVDARRPFDLVDVVPSTSGSIGDLERDPRVRTAVIGTSWWADGSHLPALSANPAVEVTALCGRNPVRLADVAGKFNVPRQYTDPAQMLRDTQPQVVFVLTPNHTHSPLTLMALEAGAHVVCEKPMALSVREARQMLQRAEHLGRRHLTFFTYRGMPGVRFVKDLIAQGYLGRLHHVQASYLRSSWLDRDRPATWKTVKAEGGTGALGDLGTHIIDLLQWWFGPMNRVAGSFQTVVPERTGPNGTRTRVDTDDSCMFVAEFAAGGQATLHASRVAAGRHGYQRIELYGSNGLLVYEYDQTLAHVGRLSGAQGRNEPQPIPIPVELAAGFVGDDSFPSVHRALLDPFLASIRTGSPSPAPNFADGLAAQCVVDAVVRSVESGRWEMVET